MQTTIQKINQRERQLLVHCCIYYDLNKNIISDDKYDSWSFELDSLIKNNPEDFKKSAYYDDFKSFNPSSGYYLNYSHPEIIRVARWLVDNQNSGGN